MRCQLDRGRFRMPARISDTNFAGELAKNAAWVMLLALAIWFIYPRLAKRNAEASAFAFWEAEQKANDQRLFGGE